MMKNEKNKQVTYILQVSVSSEDKWRNEGDMQLNNPLAELTTTLMVLQEKLISFKKIRTSGLQRQTQCRSDFTLFGLCFCVYIAIKNYFFFFF